MKKITTAIVLTGYLAFFILSSCKTNHPPTIDTLLSTMILDSNPLAYILSVSANDADGDTLQIRWACKEGSFPKGTELATIQWQPPFSYYSMHYLVIVTVSDLEFKISDTLDIMVNGSPHFTDPRDNKVYGVARIGNQTWMKENLDYEMYDWSRCYRDDPALCEQYGRLYDWEAAKSACPVGWHLPSMDEWLTLLNWASPRPGYKLKSKTGWYENGNGVDTLGFNVLPAGRWYLNENYGHMGMHTSFWTMDEKGLESALYIRFDYFGDEGYQYDTDKLNFFSVRCIQDR